MLAITTQDLDIQIRPLDSRYEAPGGPYLEWIDVAVRISVPGIEAQGSWSLMPGELHAFLQALQEMDRDGTPQAGAVLKGVEPGFAMSLAMAERGRIIGDWNFQPTPADGPTVAGRFLLDQTFIPGLMEGADSLLRFHRQRMAGT